MAKKDTGEVGLTQNEEVRVRNALTTVCGNRHEYRIAWQCAEPGVLKIEGYDIEAFTARVDVTEVFWDLGVKPVAVGAVDCPLTIALRIDRCGVVIRAAILELDPGNGRVREVKETHMLHRQGPPPFEIQRLAGKLLNDITGARQLDHDDPLYPQSIAGLKDSPFDQEFGRQM